jgi:hypothetical protein
MPLEQVRNALAGYDLGRQNLLVNPGFEIWQRGNGPVTTSGLYTADRWYITIGSGSSLSVQRFNGSALVGTQYSLTGTYTHSAPSIVAQKLDIPQLSNLRVSFGCWVWCSAANAVRLRVDDSTSGGGTPGAFVTGDSQWHWITVTQLVGNVPTAVYAVVELDASCTFYLDNATLVVGTQPVDYVPLHPNDDYERCLRYYERRPDAGTTGEMIFSGYNATASDTNYCYVPFRVMKAVMPTYTLVGTWSVSNLNQPTLNSGQKSLDGVRIDVTATAIGKWYFQNYPGTSQWITAEANP